MFSSVAINRYWVFDICLLLDKASGAFCQMESPPRPPGKSDLFLQINRRGLSHSGPAKKARYHIWQIEVTSFELRQIPNLKLQITNKLQ